MKDIDINRALKIFGLDAVRPNIEKEVKDIYRKLMRKYHPDLHGESTEEMAKDINNAYRLLIETIEKLNVLSSFEKKDDEISVLLTIDNLIDIYNGKELRFSLGDKSIILNKEALYKNRVFVDINASIKHNGMVNNFSSLSKWHYGDNYEISYNLFVEKLTNNEEITIYVQGKEMTLNFESNSLRVIFTIGNNIKINVIVNKKLRNGD